MDNEKSSQLLASTPCAAAGLGRRNAFTVGNGHHSGVTRGRERSRETGESRGCPALAGRQSPPGEPGNTDDEYYHPALLVPCTVDAAGVKHGTYDFVIKQITEDENVTEESLAARVSP